MSLKNDAQGVTPAATPTSPKLANGKVSCGSPTPAQSFVSVLTSQGSIDVFHDALSTLTIPQKYSFPSSPPLSDRQRHVTCDVPVCYSGGIEAFISPVMPGSTETKRVRHFSYCQGVKASSSSNNISQSRGLFKLIPDADFRNCVSCTNSPEKINCQKMNIAPVNYVPCVESDLMSSDAKQTPVKTVSVCGKMAANTANGNINAKWQDNYIVCVEVEDMKKAMGENVESMEKVNEKSSFLKHNLDEDSRYFPYARIRRRQGCRSCMRKEFRSSRLGLQHSYPHLFVTSQWQQPHELSCMYMGYRLFFGTYFLMWAVWSWVGFGKRPSFEEERFIKHYYLIYLTNWGIWILALDAILQAWNVAGHMRKVAMEGDFRYASMPALFRISWVLSNVTCVLQLFIALVYWVAVYPFREESVSAISVNTHMVPAVYAILDLFVSATPRHFLHCMYPLIVVTVYGAFSFVYFILGGKSHLGSVALYPILDWTNVPSTLTAVSALALFILPALQGIICALHQFKIYIWLRYFMKDGRLSSRSLDEPSHEVKV